MKNRGIECPSKYLNLTCSVVSDYKDLDNIMDAVKMFDFHYCNKNRMGILFDEDVDGYTSGAMLHNYIKRMDSEYPVEYILHNKAKAHGLSPDVVIPDNIKLLIIPDAATNDIERCLDLIKSDIEIIILDHHESERKPSDHVIDNCCIVNNQMSSGYSNKNLCGAGVVYRFLQALDEFYWTEYADDFLDLCALGNISDVMDMRSFETRYFTNMGLKNIKNKAFRSFVKAQDYSMGGVVNIHNIQWYITPMLNGMIRVGKQEEKELLVRAFIETDETFPYKKRGATKEIQENIYDRAARLCKNAKSRQDKMREKFFSEICSSVSVLEEDKVLMIDVSDTLENGLTGVVAIKLAEHFNRPCILLNRFLDKEKNKIVFGGSARNFNNSPIDDFKQVINSTGIVSGVGHGNAFGVFMDIDKETEAKDKLNCILGDTEYDTTFRVDYIVDANELDPMCIYQFSAFEELLCQGIEDPKMCVTSIELLKNDIEIFGKNEDTISFFINDIKFIQFKCKQGNELYDWLNEAWDDSDKVVIEVVGKPSINDYNGVKTPQLIIEDLNVISVSESGSYDEKDDEW